MTRRSLVLAFLGVVSAAPPPLTGQAADTWAPDRSLFGRSAADLGFDPAGLDSLVAFLRQQVDSGAFPGAVVAVGRHGQLALLKAVGVYGLDDRRPVDSTTIYDMASLTKVIGLTTAVMFLVEAGRLRLEDSAQRYVPAFRGPGKEGITLRHLLTHSSGLPAWRALFREAPTREAALALVDTTPLESPPGTKMVYSDLGAIVLTQAVERVVGQRIDQYLDTAVFRPLGMTATRYLPPGEWRDRIAPTEMDTSFRHRMIRGEVHDENSGRLEGVSGHAGLFSNAVDLARFASWLLERRHRAPVTREFTRRQDFPAGSSRALGWDTPSPGSSAGTQLSATAFGHTGFTGTSIWMDPERDLFVILLTNRVHPTRQNTAILRVRPRVADLVVRALTHSER